MTSQGTRVVDVAAEVQKRRVTSLKSCSRGGDAYSLFAREVFRTSFGLAGALRRATRAIRAIDARSCMDTMRGVPRTSACPGVSGGFNGCLLGAAPQRQSPPSDATPPCLAPFAPELAPARLHRRLNCLLYASQPITR